MPIYRYECKCGKKYDEFRKIVNRHNAPVCLCGKKTEMRIMPTSVQADIQPYRTVAYDKETGKPCNIESRKQHREFLHRNNYIELGDEMPKNEKIDDGPADAPMLSVEQMRNLGVTEHDL